MVPPSAMRSRNCGRSAAAKRTLSSQSEMSHWGPWRDIDLVACKKRTKFLSSSLFVGKKRRWSDRAISRKTRSIREVSGCAKYLGGLAWAGYVEAVTFHEGDAVTDRTVKHTSSQRDVPLSAETHRCRCVCRTVGRDLATLGGTSR